MTSINITFVTYTKGALEYVTCPPYESQFLNWLNSVDDSSGWKRETHAAVGVRCSPIAVHATEKKEASVLKLVPKQ